MKKRENQGLHRQLRHARRGGADLPRRRALFRAYEDAIRAVGSVPEQGHSISVKLSALHPRYEVAQYDRCVPSLTEQVEALATLAKQVGIAFTIDAEESERLEMSLDIIDKVAGLPALKGWDGLGMAVQAYGKRAGRRSPGPTRSAPRPAGGSRSRLVKGAYWDSEIKRTQEQGLADYPLFTRKAATDVSYLACARDMLAAKNIYPAFATHNALTVATILEWAGDSRDFEFQRLHGMGEGLYEKLVREQGYHTRIYAPVGGHRDLLAYLVRRLLENGANSSFVHQLADERLSDADILADPVAKIAAVGRHAASRRFRCRSDCSRRSGRTARASTSRTGASWQRVAEAVATSARFRAGSAERRPASASCVDSGRCGGFAAWSTRSVEERAGCLDRLADLLGARPRHADGASPCRRRGRRSPTRSARFARRSISAAIMRPRRARGLQPVELPGPTGERNVLRMEGRGVWVCIAPWNFPLAIFLGQVTAALAAGNSVVAKPALADAARSRLMRSGSPMRPAFPRTRWSSPSAAAKWARR